MPTASVLVGEKCKIVQTVAYKLSTMHCVAAVCCPRSTWRDVLRRSLVLQLSAEVKADHMAALEKQAAGQYMVDVL